ncbi:ribonuclease HII [Paracoccus sp. 11-3]|uniref:Ribonuclease HII n=1 Tax=Paracoccus amoyensis TaxID=2760093 RepID=A0A926GM35_9RHOB|nr:ribonuclease HII [Paracoccus amoyensis]MBC9246425.1 ribonuclease HII [Paracoccus amoyensis]
MKSCPDYSFELAAMSGGARLIAGVDEVGRGPLAGPVMAAAVILDPQNIPEGLNDSKQLSAKRRVYLAEWIEENCDWGLGSCSVDEIDALNIYHAAHLAMSRAVMGLRQVPDHVLIDGNKIPKGINHSAEAIVKGDTRSLSISAASILAKVLRDRIMVDLAQQHPGYGWDVNAGYPTPAHKKALLDLGVTPHHRRSFKPVHYILCKDG